jgi:hypothetical protein
MTVKPLPNGGAGVPPVNHAQDARATIIIIGLTMQADDR